MSKASMTKITNQEIIDAWNKVFPDSLMLVSKACLGNSYHFRAILAKDKREVSNGILENDPLSYQFTIENETYKESCNSIYIKPNPVTEKYLCYGRSNIRLKTIKDLTLDKLLKRFKEVRDHVIANKDNFKDLLFDINTKIGVA